MPQPGDVEHSADALIAAYRAARDDLNAAIAAASGRDSTKLRRILGDLDAIFADLDEQTRAWITDTIPKVYTAGAVATGIAASFNQTSPAAVQALANQNYNELLTTVQHTEGVTRRELRTLARAGALDVVAGGTPAGGVGRDLSNTVQDAASKVLTVTYSNGAVHSLADWADTALRTQTALAYNAGTIDRCRAGGVEWVELADGMGCGLTYHDDPELANGLIVPLSTAESYPIAHPRCSRSILPRADITSEGDATDVNDARDLDALQADAAAERARAARGTVTGRRFKVDTETARVAGRQRAGRTAGGERPPRQPRTRERHVAKANSVEQR